MFEAVPLNGPGPEQGTAAKTGTAKGENGCLQVERAEPFLWAEPSTTAERGTGTGSRY